MRDRPLFIFLLVSLWKFHFLFSYISTPSKASRGIFMSLIIPMPYILLADIDIPVLKFPLRLSAKVGAKNEYKRW